MAKDPKVPKSSIDMSDFPGMLRNQDPQDLPPGGAEVQLNLACIERGQMRSRGGMRQVTFEDQT